MNMSFDVDLVYAWVDGNDPAILAKRKESAIKTGRTDMINMTCRFYNNEELKYSLRSVEKYIPWVRKIFIITDHQVPPFVDTSNEKIRIVDHSEIMPPEDLPCFNSTAFEHGIPYIKGLADHYLYANDDMFVVKPVDKSFFFNEKGYPICRYMWSYRKQKHIDSYTTYIKNGAELINSKFGVLYHRWPHHNMDSYYKPDVLDCYNMFKTEIDRTKTHPFRDNSDIERDIYALYSCVIGHGTYSVRRLYDTDASPLELLKMHLAKQHDIDSWQYAAREHKIILKRNARFNPKLICINDDESVKDKDRIAIRTVFETLFPEKSSFEK